MIELLKEIQKALRAGLTGLRDQDIYITPHIGFIPDSARRPCIGIKDGKVIHKYGMSHSKDYQLPVRLAIFVDLAKKEDSLIGDASGRNKGVLEISKDCIDILENNMLGIEGLDGVRVVDDPESEMFGMKHGPDVQRKQLGLLYEKVDF